ncbi:MAG: hypothetical protein HXY21_13865 [Parvularculaceae bacterium]|nr:hypothetical protein [Parvularculaceae bacterium]
MARGMFVGLGAVGAAAAGLASVYVVRDRASPEPALIAARSAPETVCIESNVRLVEGMSRSCRTAAQFEALRDRPVVGGDGTAIAVNLVGPADETDANSVRTCAEYDSLIASGWYALSSADLRREEYFKRACGALSLLVTAKPARLSHFAGGKAEPADIFSMAREDAIAFGEAAPEAPVDVAEIESGVWKVAIGEGETVIYEIAHADFTGDGVGEILAYVSAGAPGGTARVGSIGFIEKPNAGGPCSFSPR